jgi:hypothetical protein
LAEDLIEEQLAIFDVLMRRSTELSEDENVQVKRVAEKLLKLLKRGHAVAGRVLQEDHTIAHAPTLGL